MVKNVKGLTLLFNKKMPEKLVILVKVKVNLTFSQKDACF